MPPGPANGPLAPSSATAVGAGASQRPNQEPLGILGVDEYVQLAKLGLPLPLAPSLSLTSPWQQHHCSLSAPRRSAGTAAAARSCGVVVCCHRDDVPLRAESFSAFGARRRAPSHLQSLRHNVRNRSAPSALGAVRLPLCKAFDTTWRGRS